MFFLFSGEGITDLGAGNSDAVVCQGHDYFVGPMAIMADHVVEGKHGYSIVDAGCCGYVSERNLSNAAVELKTAKKSLGLPGKKRAKETRYFFNNARVLSRIAKEKQTGLKDDVVAVLFRDCDGTASAGRGLWDDKRKSMLDGFDEERFSKGVPMIPKPQSEAWLICALKQRPYQRCEGLEDRSGNDNSPKSLKGELERIIGEDVTPELLCQKVRNKSVDVDRIKMPSFNAFRERLEEVIE
ncbi:MAG TPA: hypothetical protein VMV69_29280 [Pirellulales bacterium]|nr:hypothetical protein [Pirellulales bacterium]